MRPIDKKPLISALLLLVYLTGCANKPPAIQEAPAYEVLKPGATLILHEAIRFPAYTAAVTIQSGRIPGIFSLDKYYPNCRLELRSQSDNNRTVHPDRFTIYRINTNIEYVMSNPVKVAGLGLHMADATTNHIYSTIMHLKSEKQSDVELLSCQHWEDPTGFPTHLSLRQIQQTLEGLFTVETN